MGLRFDTTGPFRFDNNLLLTEAVHADLSDDEAGSSDDSSDDSDSDGDAYLLSDRYRVPVCDLGGGVNSCLWPVPGRYMYWYQWTWALYLISGHWGAYI